MENVSIKYLTNSVKSWPECQKIRDDYLRWIQYMDKEVDFWLKVSDIHTKEHCARVLLYCLMMASELGLSEREKNILACAACFHDSRRLDEWYDTGHGDRAADYYRDVAGENFEPACYAIMAYHDRDDEIGIGKIGELSGGEVDAVLLYRLFKDADALDRLRLGRHGLDLGFLRTEVSRKLYPFAKMVWEQVEQQKEIYGLKLPGRRFIGEGALLDAIDAIAGCGKCALIVTGTSMVNQGHADRLMELLAERGIVSYVYNGVTGEPTDVMVEKGVARYEDKNCDFIIGFGGGSQLDCAKAIGAMAVHSGDIADYSGKIFTKELPKLVAIPSTAGTGSEATAVTIITDTKSDVKMLLKGEVLMPDIAVVDPVYTMQVPPNVTAWTGLDALTHAIEAYTSVHAYPECDEYAISAIRRIFKNLPLAFVDGSNYRAREELAIAAYEAGVTIRNSTVTLVHGMSRPIGAVFHVPHGLSNAMLLRACLEFAKEPIRHRLAYLATVIGKADENDDVDLAADKFIDAVGELCAFLKVPDIQEYGIDRDDFVRSIHKMAVDAAASGSPANTRRHVTITDMEDIYLQII